MDLTQFKEQLDFLLAEFSQVKHIFDTNQKEYETLFNQVSLAKKRLEQQPEINLLLNETQDDIMKKSLTLFNDLLSAMLQNIMANNERVSCELTSYSNLPALKILIEDYFNGQLKQRDIYHSKGGSVVNIISTGLRILSLLKLSIEQGEHRPFLVLDEPDNWLSPDKVEPFADLLIEIAKAQNMQIIMITHHDLMNFQKASCVSLNKKDNTVFIEKTQGDFNWFDEENDAFYSGIQGIFLENYMSHTNTYIPFSRHLTVISGKNDLGKSAIIQAIHDTAYGTGDDLNIKDIPQVMDYSQVSIFFETGKCVWRRNRKTNQKNKSKELYTLYQFEGNTALTYQQNYQNKNGFYINPNSYHYQEEPFMVSPGGKGYSGVPDFVRDRSCLGISKVENIDIQIRNQKEPIFLLNETGTTQAKILSVGQEINYLQTMREEYKLNVQLDKKCIDEGEKRISAILTVQDRLFPIVEKLSSLSLKLTQNARNIYAKDNFFKLFETFNNQFLSTYKLLTMLKETLSVIQKPKTTVNIEKTIDIQLLLNKLNSSNVLQQQLTFVSTIKQPNTVLSQEMLTTTNYLTQLINNIEKTNGINKQFSFIKEKLTVIAPDYQPHISKESIAILKSLTKQVSYRVKLKTIDVIAPDYQPQTILGKRIENGHHYISKIVNIVNVLKEQGKEYGFSIETQRKEMIVNLKTLEKSKNKEYDLSICQNGLLEAEIEKMNKLKSQQKNCPCCGKNFH